MKKKSHPKVDFTLSCSLVLKNKDCPFENLMHKTIQNLLTASCGLNQMHTMKKLQEDLDRIQWDKITTELSMFNNFVMLYFQTPSKFPLKKAFHNILKILESRSMIPVVQSLSRALKQLISSGPFNFCGQSDPVLDGITSILNSLPFGKEVIAEHVLIASSYLGSYLSLLCASLRDDNCIYKSNTIYSECILTLKAITHLLQHFKREFSLWFADPKSSSFQSLQTVLTNVAALINSDHMLQTCGLNAGIVFALLLRYNKQLDFLAYCYSLHDSKLDLPLIKDLPDASRLFIWNGFLAAIPSSELLMFDEGNLLFCAIASDIFSICERAENVDLILLSSRTLLQWTICVHEIISSKQCSEKVISMFADGGTILNTLVQYVLANREHFIDNVRHTTKEIFENTVKLNLLSSQVDPKEREFLKSTCKKLLEMPVHHRGKYSLLSCLTRYLGSSVVLSLCPTLPEDIYSALEESGLASHVSEFFEVLCVKSQAGMSDIAFKDSWLKPFCHHLISSSKQQRMAIIQYILPVLLKTSSIAVEFLISELCVLCMENLGQCFGALVACLKFKQKKGIQDVECKSMLHHHSILTPMLQNALCHAEDEVRLSAFSFICDTHKTTEPVSSTEFHLLKYALPWNICSQCPAFRQQFISIFKKFLNRLKESCAQLKKLKENRKAVTEYKTFLVWLESYLISCLFPGANFPRRVTALNLLMILHSVLEVPSNYDTVVELGPFLDSPDKVQTILETLKDTYENNKQAALFLLNSQEHTYFFKDMDVIHSLFTSALNLLHSTKPPDSVTASYIMSLLVKFDATSKVGERFLQNKALNYIIIDGFYGEPVSFVMIQVLQEVLKSQLQSACQSLITAAAHGPIYGVLICIRYILKEMEFSSINHGSVDAWREEFEKLISVCLEVASVVEPVVCNSSPEGHLPMDTDQESINLLQDAVQNALSCRFKNAVVSENLKKDYSSDSLSFDLVKTHAVTAQMLLLCSWRTHKEVSLLFGELSEKVPIMDCERNCDLGVISPEQLLCIGRYFTTQLSQVKHRGAFEQAYVGFCKLCNRLWRSPFQSLHELPKNWLKELFDMISGSVESMDLCSSRRSAGLPYMMQALLVSEPDIYGSSTFKSAMKTLLDFAASSQEHGIDCQVHCLNILRALYRDSNLGESVMPFVARGLKASIVGFKSFSWAVRNSSTLLFSALITRIFGVNRSRTDPHKKNCLTGHVFFSRFQELYEFLLQELELSAKELQSYGKQERVPLHPSLYPVLLVLGRLYPSPIEGSDSTIMLSNFVPYLLDCAGSPIWKTRVLAAKALVPLVLHKDHLRIFEQLYALLPKCFYQSNFNRVHGILLQILYILKEMSFNNSPSAAACYRNLSRWNSSVLFLGLKENPCYVTKAAYLEIFCWSLRSFHSKGIEAIEQCLVHVMEEASVSQSSPGREEFLVQGVQFTLIYAFKGFCEASNPDLKNVFMCFLSSPVVEVRLSILQCLLHLYDFNSHCLPDEPVIDCYNFRHMILSLSNEEKKKIEVEISAMAGFIAHDMLNLETHPECLEKLYLLLCCISEAVIRMWEQSIEKTDIVAKLNSILRSMQEASQDSVVNSMLLFSSHVSLYLYEQLEKAHTLGSHQFQEMTSLLETWFSEVESYALPDRGLQQRLTVLYVLDNVKSTLLCDPHEMMGSKTCILWKSLLLLLTDDDPEVKNGAAKIVMGLKQRNKRASEDNEKCLLSATPVLALEEFIKLFVHQFKECDPNCCFVTLLEWILHVTGELDCVMDDEQPFDKGEMNVFAEDFTLAELVSRQLSYLLSAQTDLAHFTVPVEKFSHLKTHFDDESKKDLSLDDIVKLSIADIYSILELFEYSPFLNRSFDKHLLQISQRTSVIQCLKPFVHNSVFSSSEKSLHAILQCLKKMSHKNAFLMYIFSILSECIN